jgi:tellurite resistance protein
MMMASLKKKQTFQESKRTQIEELSAEMPSSYDGDSTTTNTTMHQVLEGLQNSQGNKEIPFSPLYDKKGSEL